MTTELVIEGLRGMLESAKEWGDSDGIDMIQTAISIIDCQRWTPCSERAPEDGVYLVTRKDHIGRPSLVDKKRYAKNLYKVSEFVFHDKKGKGGWYDYDSEWGYWEDTEVVAWTPLPEPWKGEE